MGPPPAPRCISVSFSPLHLTLSPCAQHLPSSVICCNACASKHHPFHYLYPLTLGERWGTPWTGCLCITGSTFRDKNPLSTSDNLEISINLNHVFKCMWGEARVHTENEFESCLMCTTGWLVMEAMRVEGEKVGREGVKQWRPEAPAGWNRDVSRKAVSREIEELFSCHIKSNQPSTIELCSDTGGLALLWRLIINAMELLLKTVFHRPNLDGKDGAVKKRERGERWGETWIPMDCNKYCFIQLSIIHLICLKFSSMDFCKNGIKVIWEHYKKKKRIHG